MSNFFSGHSPSRFNCGTDIQPVSPSDTDDLPAPAVALYVETAGDIVVETYSGATARTIAVASNSWLPVAVVRVRSTGTTASGIHAVVIV